MRLRMPAPFKEDACLGKTPHDLARNREWLAALACVVTENAALADDTLHDPAQTERLRVILHLWKD